MYNRVILVGRLTRDPELRYLQNGTALATFGIATNRTWMDRNTNEKKEEVMFIDITTFARSAEIANQYLKKGSKVLVEGRLAQERWTDQNGQNRSKHIVRAEAIQFMDTKDERQGSQNSYSTHAQGGYAPQNQTVQQPSMPSTNVPEVDIDDDEIPF